MVKRKQLSSDLRQRIIQMSKEGSGKKKIASNSFLYFYLSGFIIKILETLRIPVSTARNIIKKFNETGSHSPKPRSGRPKVLSARETSYLCYTAKKDPTIGSRKLSEIMKENSQKKISPSSVRRILIKNNLRAFVMKKKHLLTKKMMTKRLKWAREYVNKPVEFWRNVLFSDESYIDLFGGHKIYARRPIGTGFASQFVRQSPKHPLKVMIWGCFSSKGVGRIKVVEGTMKSDDYINVLDTKMVPTARDMFPNGNYVYQDDGAPCHRSKKVKDWHTNNRTQLLEWPGNSPDMNPIENLWAILKMKVRNKMPSGRTSLIAAIIRCWFDEITPELCLKLADSMPKRLQSVIANKGGHTKY